MSAYELNAGDANRPLVAELAVRTSSLLKFADTNEESKAKAGSLSRQHATGMSEMRIVLNLLLPSVGAILALITRMRDVNTAWWPSSPT